MNLREQFEKLHPVPEGIEWFPHQESYDADNDTPLRYADAYNALWQGFQSGHAANCSPEDTSTNEKGEING